MVTAIQTIPSALAASVLPILRPISELAQKTRAAIFTPGVIVTLGAVAPQPLIYNAAGLLTSQALQSLDTPQATLPVINNANTPAAAAITATANNTASLPPVADVVVPLSAGVTDSSPGVVSTLVSVQGSPPTSIQDLTTLLTPDLSVPTAVGVNTVTASQALASQLTVSNPAATVLDTTPPTSSVFSLTGILPEPPPAATIKALDNLLAADLGIVALAPDIIPGVGGTTTASGSTVIAPIIVATTPAISAPAPVPVAANINTTGPQNIPPLVSVDFAAPATKAAVNGAANQVANNAVTPAVVSAPTAAPVAAVVTVPAVATTVSASNVPNTAGAGNASNTPVNTSATSQNLLQDADAQALANIGWNPAYANAGAGVYLNMAAINSKQALFASLSNVMAMVQPVISVPPVKAI
jgi:hypothetical protein